MVVSDQLGLLPENGGFSVIMLIKMKHIDHFKGRPNRFTLNTQAFVFTGKINVSKGIELCYCILWRLLLLSP